MARIKPVFRPDDHPSAADPDTSAQLAALWQHLFPDGDEGEPHAGYALLAQSPRLALGVAQLGDVIPGELGWSQRRDLRELAVQAINWHYTCDFSFHAHLDLAQLSGITLEQQAAIPFWQTSALFDEEQRLVIEYTLACVQGDVPAELFARVVEHYDEKGAVEFTATVGWWAWWAMLLNALRPEYTADRARPLPKDGSELEVYAPD